MPTRLHPSNSGSVTVGDREIQFKAGEPFEVSAPEAALLDAEGFTEPKKSSAAKAEGPTTKGSEPDHKEP